MYKKYIKPEMEITEFEVEDVITTSPGSDEEEWTEDEDDPYPMS